MRVWMAVAAVVLMAACGSDSTGPGDGGNNGGGNGNPNLSGSMSARIDGQAWTASVVVSASRTDQFITIGGASSDPVAIAFVIGPLTAEGTGTYLTGSGRPTNLSMNNGANVWVASPAGGSVTFNITSLSATAARGTFSGTVTAGTSSTTPQTRTLTQGTFDVKFQNTN